MCWPRRLRTNIASAYYTVSLDPGLVGITVRSTSKGALVVYVPDTRHETLGCMNVGDIITHVNNDELTGMSSADMMHLLASTRSHWRTLRCVPFMCALE